MIHDTASYAIERDSHDVLLESVFPQVGVPKLVDVAGESNEDEYGDKRRGKRTTRDSLPDLVGSPG